MAFYIWIGLYLTMPFLLLADWLLNLSEVLIEQIHVAGEITVILRTASLAAGCPCCFSRALRTNRPLWQNTM